MPEINMPMMVIRKRLSATEGAPADTRVNPDTGEVETSVDGGATWTPNPGADPRINPAYLMPNTATACAAAAGMVYGMKQFAAASTTVTTVGGIATILLGVVLFLIPVSWMFLAFLSAAGAFVLAGGAAIWADFTEDVWDELQCIFYCNINGDGSLDEVQFATIKTRIADLGIANVTFGTNMIFDLWGIVGFNNAGVVYADEEADCSACDCTVCEDKYVDFAGGVVPDYVFVGQTGLTPNYGVFDATVFRSGGGSSKSEQSPTSMQNYVTIDLGRECTVQNFNWWCRCQNYTAGNSFPATWALYDGDGVQITSSYTNLPVFTSWVNRSSSGGSFGGVRYVMIGAVSVAGNSNWITDITINVLE